MITPSASMNANESRAKPLATMPAMLLFLLAGYYYIQKNLNLNKVEEEEREDVDNKE